MEDILLIDKSKGITSYDIIRKLKTKYPKGTKIGHAGTLDPNASGLMIIGIAGGTKVLREYIGLDKTYEAEILLGTQTDSGDITGKVVKKESVIKIDNGEIKEILAGLIGPIRLPVPKQSAKKIGGKRSYALARAGKEMPTILQDMDVYKAVLQKHYAENSSYVLDVMFQVSSGTYIRSIAEEVGNQLGVPATLKNLRRTQVGTFDVINAQQLEDIRCYDENKV